MIKHALKRLFRRGEYGWAKILTLAIGLPFGLIMLSAYFYLHSFESFYPDADRTYSVISNLQTEGQEASDFPGTSGGVAPGLKAEIAAVEAATRYTGLWRSRGFSIDKPGNEAMRASFAQADSSLFDVLQRPILQGDPHRVLSTPMQCMISDELAQTIEGNPVGRRLYIEVADKKHLCFTIGGVFERIPDNSKTQFDVFIALTDTLAGRGRNGWTGNDRYNGYVRLAKGIDPASLAPAIRKMQEKYQDISNVEQHGVRIKYHLVPMRRMAYFDKDTQRTLRTVSAVGIVLLLSTVVNYLLLMLASMPRRGKEIAMRKCMGASRRHIYAIVLLDTVLILVLSLALGGLGVWALRGAIEAFIGAPLAVILNVHVWLPLLLIMLLVLVVCSLVPGYLYQRIPVVHVLSKIRLGRRMWHLVFLGIEVAVAAFAVAMLLVINRQYQTLLAADLGYNPQGLYVGWIGNLKPQQQELIARTLETIPEVESRAASEWVPLQNTSGNNIFSLDGKDVLFNCSDLYQATPNILHTLGVPVIEGKDFDQATSVAHDVLVSRSFAQRLMERESWRDGVLGKPIKVSEHNDDGSFQIVRGVYADFIIGDAAYADDRPSMFSFSTPDSVTRLSYMLFRLKVESAKTLAKVKVAMETTVPGYSTEGNVWSIGEEVSRGYVAQKRMRTTLVLGSVIALIIVLIGLMGYTLGEVERRSKEIAIRKINGAGIRQILGLFIRSLMWMAVPATVVGLALAYLAADSWLGSFSVRCTLPLWMFITAGLFLLVVVCLCIIGGAWRIARRRPVLSLRSE